MAKKERVLDNEDVARPAVYTKRRMKVDVEGVLVELNSTFPEDKWRLLRHLEILAAPAPGMRVDILAAACSMKVRIGPTPAHGP